MKEDRSLRLFLKLEFDIFWEGATNMALCHGEDEVYPDLLGVEDGR